MNTRSRAWCFTLNNVNPEATEEEVRAFLPSTDGVFWSCQIERAPKTGMPHLQGYIHFPNAKSFKRMAALLPTAHLETARGTLEENCEYTGKEETRISGPYVHGVKPVQGKRSDLTDFCEQFIAKRGRLDYHDPLNARMLLLHPSGINTLRRAITVPPRAVSQPLEVLVLWGPAGTGKTRWVFDNFLPDAIFMFPPPSNRVLWADGYGDQPVAVIDDFDDQDYTLSFMKRIMDRYVHCTLAECLCRGVCSYGQQIFSQFGGERKLHRFSSYSFGDYFQRGSLLLVRPQRTNTSSYYLECKRSVN